MKPFEIMPPESRSTPEILDVRLFKDETAGTERYEKVGDKEGSNPGGWYKKKSTGELFYFKLYENPDNARIEYLANQIYKKLGIRAAVSELFLSGDDLWVASKKIGEAIRASKEEQQNNVEFKNGFVADAYLCNWDVVGDRFDNVIKDTEGKLYRIDSGGSGPVRASGKPKVFPPGDVRELDEMRDPQFEAGQIFKGVTDADIVLQSKHLLSVLDDEFLRDMYRESGLSGEVGEAMLHGLLGRKRYLKSHYS